ncbi:MAG: DUF1833 family protein [Phycisphaerales bacterium]
MRPISPSLRRALYGPQTGEALVLLLDLEHPTFEPIRVCHAGEDVVSGGLTYVHFPFEIAFPDDADEAPPTVTLRISNVDRRVTAALRSISGDPITVRLRLVAADAPDMVEAGPFEFSLREATYDQGVVEGRLQYEDVLNEPFPGDLFTPSRTPGLFRTGVDEE